MEQYVIGIDVGGQTAKCGVVDARGTVLSQVIVKSNTQKDAKEFVDEVASALNMMITDLGFEGKIKGIGVGAPNGNYYTGNIETAPNVVWAKDCVVPLAKMLSEAMGGIPVALTNDANAAAQGEMTYGVAKGMKHFIMITLGTGVGSGIIVDGKVLYGSDGLAGELGHATAVRGGRQCNCGRKGCLETYCSATGVARTAKEWLESTDEPSLLRNEKEISSKTVYDAAKQGDALAKRVFDYTGTILGEKLADFVTFSAPQAIVLFGGLTRAKEFIDEPIRKAYKDSVLWMWKDTQILYSQLPESDAAILGASSLGWDF